MVTRVNILKQELPALIGRLRAIKYKQRAIPHHVLINTLIQFCHPRPINDMLGFMLAHNIIIEGKNGGWLLNTKRIREDGTFRPYAKTPRANKTKPQPLLLCNNGEAEENIHA